MPCSLRTLALSAVAGLAVASPATRSLPAQTTPVVRDSTVGRHRIQVLPALGSAPETGLQYGITGFAVFERPPVARTRPATAMAYAIRTARSQTRIGIEGEHWSTGNDRRLAGTLVWQEYPLPFYGIGDRTPETAKEIFSPRGIEATATVQQRLARSLYGMSTLRVIDQTITPDSTGALRVSGLPGVTGGRVVELTLGALDDTRDNLFAPAAGHLVQLSYGRALDGLGSDFDYGRVRLDARTYRSMGGIGVLAGQVVAVGMDGAAPFDGLAMVGGGDIMRGYARGRYRDSWFAGAQAEYRTPMRGRVGGVVFGGAGFVAPRLGALFDGQVLPSYGAGLRVGLDAAQRTAVRIDYGRGRAGNSGLYIGFNQAF